MVREIITVQVGQCGNQIGHRFWELALAEHAAAAAGTAAGAAAGSAVDRGPTYDEAMSTFFRNADARSAALPVNSTLCALKARAVLIDMEEKVLARMHRGELAELFDSAHTISDVSGSGNNWSEGYHVYGPQHSEAILEQVRVQAEMCDSLQSFFLVHSMGGGTGSGLGSYVCELLKDNYAEIYRFVTAVFPSHDDDVVTSPYNAVLACARLIDNADCVIPIENQALADIMAKIEAPARAGETRLAGSSIADVAARAQAFAGMNSLAARVLLNLTCSMRFAGSLNVDLNEITMNLVPFPRMHFLVAALAPLYSVADVRVPPRRLNQMFADVFAREHQLLSADPSRATYLACGLIVRGAVEMSDVRRNIDRMRPKLRFAYFNEDGWKVGLCAMPPVGQDRSLLCLANNTCMRATLAELLDRFTPLYRRGVYVHHYTRNMDKACFDQAFDSVAALQADYSALEAAVAPAPVTGIRIAPTF